MTLPNLIFLQSASSPSGSVPDIIRLLRKHLDMDIAFVSEFIHGNREIKYVDADEANCPVQPGLCTPIEETYCKLIIDGKLPSLMPDVNAYPTAVALAVTAELGIGSYVAAPIRLADGTVYGTFCCYSHMPDHSLNERDLAMIRVCADMAAKQVDRERSENEKRREIETRISSVLSSGRMTMMYQPIFDVRENRIAGFEALSRFGDAPGTAPDVFFNDAHEVGLGVQLEMKAIRLGLQALPHFDSDSYVALNISPKTILSPLFGVDFFGDAPLEKITLEITEHAAVDQYHEIEAALLPARRHGIQLAVDDAGAGYASFRHILHLAPDRIKLDCSLTKDIDTDPTRRALIAAFVRFSSDTGATLIAEGVETAPALRALQDLGVEKVQGYFLGRPMPMQQAISLLQA